MAEIRVGISGWLYPPWRGNFYPAGLPHRLELSYASRRFNALEVNGTFYSLKRPSVFRSWYDETPAGFVFALKGGRYITHMRKLREPRQPLANFLASRVLCLREKLGPIFWQFPPVLPFVEDRFKEFFDLLPHDTVELSRVARNHSTFLKKRVELEPDAKRPVRHAIEFRHESFLTDRFIDLLRRYNLALVVADVASKFPTAEDVTADWVYVRLHGSRQLYASGYSPREIAAWAAKVRAWSRGTEPADARRIGGRAATAKGGRDVYVFFDNTDVKLRAPVDARRMANELRIGPRETTRRTLAALAVKPKARRKKPATSIRPGGS
ncbi:MAG TPA: DUF72 domain-containing protein [Gemmataceae bacterium]|nr:DUF72 domain-containing protein [Gemmataceae bacterium]